MTATLPPPSDRSQPPRRLLAELAGHVGEQEAARLCADLLEGGDPQARPGLLGYLAGRPADRFLEGTWGPPYWSRVWGARGLLYVWSPDAASAVATGVDDEAWRVAEMCLKVAARRGVAGVGDGAGRLSTHPLARVRLAALRALEAVGDTEHVDAVRSARDDTEPEVRRVATRALDAMTDRLDLPREE